VKKRFGVPFYMNELDMPFLDSIPVQARMFGIPDPGVITVDQNLPESGEISIADLTLKLLYTPGHSRGSISILIEDTLFTGDALFNFSIGRTDLPGGNYQQLINSVNEKIFVLPDETIVLPGHGPETTVGREREFNPFFS
jgi:hydroxyacylglutathione hydrolase